MKEPNYITPTFHFDLTIKGSISIQANSEDEARTNIKGVYLREHSLKITDDELRLVGDEDIDYKELANVLLNDLCNEDLGDAISRLVGYGYTEKQMLALGFDDTSVSDYVALDKLFDGEGV